MPGFDTIKVDLLAFEAALGEKKPSKILTTFGALAADAGEIVAIFEGGLFAVGPNDAADKAECVACCDRLKAKCSERATMQAAPGTVGKIFPGDGSFLKALIEIVLKLAPLFVEPAPTA